MICRAVFCGMTMRLYIASNFSGKSYTAVKYFIHMLANMSESLVFMFMGIELVMRTHSWDPVFIILALLFCIIYRPIGSFWVLFSLQPFSIYIFPCCCSSPSLLHRICLRFDLQIFRSSITNMDFESISIG